MATRARRFDGISRTVYRQLPHSVTFIAASIREIAFRHTIVGPGATFGLMEAESHMGNIAAVKYGILHFAQEP